MDSPRDPFDLEDDYDGSKGLSANPIILFSGICPHLDLAGGDAAHCDHCTAVEELLSLRREAPAVVRVPVARRSELARARGGGIRRRSEYSPVCFDTASIYSDFTKRDDSPPSPKWTTPRAIGNHLLIGYGFFFY